MFLKTIHYFFAVLLKWLSLHALFLVLLQPLSAQADMIGAVGIGSTLKWVKLNIKEKPVEKKEWIYQIIEEVERNEDHKRAGETHNILADFLAIRLKLPNCFVACTPRLRSGYNQSEPRAEPRGGLEKIISNFRRVADFYTTSLYAKKANTLESELGIKYESSKKDETIATQESTILQQKKVQLLSVGILGLLIALLSSLYFNFRKNKQNNSLLKLQNQQIEERSIQNELLLKEIHHRVKNNLQTVSSLLALQSNRIQDSVALDAIQGSRNRVQSMSMIHQKLYQGENLACIEMKDYFIDLSDGILHTFGMQDQIEVNCNMDVLEMDVDVAVPIGLIVNELLTNTLKYAFPGEEKGFIKIALTKDSKNYLLTYLDNGIGKNAEAVNTKIGFGSQLIKLLSKQLNATMEEVVKNGTKIIIKFPDKLADDCDEG